MRFEFEAQKVYVFHLKRDTLSKLVKSYIFLCFAKTHNEYAENWWYRPSNETLWRIFCCDDTIMHYSTAA